VGRWVGLDGCGTRSLGVWIPDGPVPSEKLYRYVTCTLHTNGTLLRYQEPYNFDVLLTVHLSIILVINQINAQILILK